MVDMRIFKNLKQSICRRDATEFCIQRMSAIRDIYVKIINNNYEICILGYIEIIKVDGLEFQGQNLEGRDELL